MTIVSPPDLPSYAVTLWRAQRDADSPPNFPFSFIGACASHSLGCKAVVYFFFCCAILLLLVYTSAYATIPRWLDIEAGALHVLDKCSTTRLHPHPSFLFESSLLPCIYSVVHADLNLRISFLEPLELLRNCIEMWGEWEASQILFTLLKSLVCPAAPGNGTLV